MNNNYIIFYYKHLHEWVYIRRKKTETFDKLKTFNYES